MRIQPPFIDGERWEATVIVGYPQEPRRCTPQTFVQGVRPLTFLYTILRLRVVPRFSSGTVERAKRKRAWKSPHARKGDTQRGESLFSRAVIFTRARVSLALLSPRKNEGLLVFSAILDRKGIPFVLLLLTNCTPFIYTFRSLHPFQLLLMHCLLNRDESQKQKAFSRLTRSCAPKFPLSLPLLTLACEQAFGRTGWWEGKAKSPFPFPFLAIFPQTESLFTGHFNACHEGYGTCDIEHHPYWVVVFQAPRQCFYSQISCGFFLRYFFHPIDPKFDEKKNSFLKNNFKRRESRHVEMFLLPGYQALHFAMASWCVPVGFQEGFITSLILDLPTY